MTGMSYARELVRELNAEGVYQWAVRCVAELSHRRAEINALNVFPVPDSDTGSNMAFTMEAALKEAERAVAEGGDVAAALARGAVRGARGNSGMVLSQVLRAVSESTHASTVDAAVLAEALQLAVSLVDRAIAEPVEGTIVTVLRAAAAAAADALSAEPGADLHAVLEGVVAAARVSLAATPSQLPALRAAGVVDAGGAGLVILLECLLAEVEGADARAIVEMTSSQGELEVVFFYEGDLDALTDIIAPLGNSLVIARETENSGSVHIHSTQAGTIIEAAFGAGAVSQLRIEALPGTAAPGEAPRSELLTVAATSGSAAEAGDGGEAAASASEAEPTGHVFAVAPAGPIADLFASAGAVVVDASTPAEAGIPAGPKDFFLANGHDIDPGAARLIPTDSYVEGIAAISVYDPAALDLEPLVINMRDAARAMRWCRLPASTQSAVAAAARELLSSGGERVTVLCPRPLDEQALAEALGVDVQVVLAPGIDTEIGVE